MKTKTTKEGYAISADEKGKFFKTRSAAEKYIRRENKQLPYDCQMKESDIYRTNK